MNDFAAFEERLTQALSLTRRPVAVAFRESPPDGVAKLPGTQPSSCSFWRLAAAGQVFYTVPSDHYNCPMGSYTHNIPLPKEREPELTNMLSMMVNVGYLKMEEVPAIPRLAATPGVAIYAPLSMTPVEPDAVIVSGQPGRLMLMHEAATRATLPGERSAALLPLLGRPTCMAIPAAIAAGGAASSLGCIGNRIYTGMTDDELYTVIAGRDLAPLIAELDAVWGANAVLNDYHTSRRASLATA